MKKAIYVGCGTDILPILSYPEIKEWIYLDSLPNNEFGPEYNKDYCHPYFVNDLINQFTMFGFTLKANTKDIIESNNDNMVEFINTNTDQHVKVCINTYLPDSIDNVKDEIKDWDTLFVIGHHPDSCIMQYRSTTYPSTMVGFAKTYYGNEEVENPNNVIIKIFEKEYNFDNYIFNKTEGWWDLYSKLKDELEPKNKKPKFTFDSDLLPGTLMNLHQEIIMKIKEYYYSDEIKNNDIHTKDWGNFQELSKL